MTPLSLRQFSLISIHTTFPATLHRFQPQRLSLLGDQYQSTQVSLQDCLHVAKDGLIYPRLLNSFPYSNGLVFNPNTVSMQELLHNDYDIYLKDLEAGESPADPHVISIPRGTAIPLDLILFREQGSRFSLQPSHPLSLNEFNKVLDKFYAAAAIFTEAVEWMEMNEFHKAFTDSESEDWMRE
ncbi:hypothetical protein ASPCADRAFT_179909 [Aspergillus carbonarius ITEM 5010]|uniref:Tse2 ADP-ribosyltransferase toxin domain-containing protein n=1 Tax=Aspergillus carbonarius (strain ITEM 5010) TaxID=602072 RepID=A0A1R3R6A5_ASPC5|nr:hypothetical protein ASPCADRAFT_179909 [Aspergillus carbonarius ITEM 5010]